MPFASPSLVTRRLVTLQQRQEVLKQIFSLTLCMLLAALLGLNSCERLVSLWERCLPVLRRIEHAPST